MAVCERVWLSPAHVVPREKRYREFSGLHRSINNNAKPMVGVRRGYLVEAALMIYICITYCSMTLIEGTKYFVMRMGYIAEKDTHNTPAAIEEFMRKQNLSLAVEEPNFSRTIRSSF